MLGSKKPKFKFIFSINELSNIPHTSGFCYAELTVNDGSSSGFMDSLSHLKPFSNKTTGSESPSDDASDLSDGGKEAVAHSSSRSIHVRTARYKIHNFKCHFSFNLTCNLKFPLKRKENMIGDKVLSLRVFYVSDKSVKSEHPVQLGEIRLNLSEYLNFNEPITAKYLLQESKINSIMTLTTGLEELPSDFEFHTQLRIDTKRTNTNPNSYTSISKAATKGPQQYNVPQFQKKTVFGGLEGVINPSSGEEDDNEDIGDLESPDDASLNEKEKSEEQTKQSPKQQSKQQSNHRMNSMAPRTIEDVTVDPIIGSLYRNVLESMWDPDLHDLLKLTPQKVVDDIFQMSDHPENMSKNLKYYQSLSKDTEDEGLKNANGLIVESKLRNNLKSWSVSWT